jgi:hypothetical protein
VGHSGSVKVGELIEVFVEHPFVLARSKGLNSNSSFFIFGELMVHFVSGVHSSEAFSWCGGCRDPKESLVKTPIKQRIRALQSGCFFFFTHKPTDIEKDVVHVR